MDFNLSPNKGSKKNRKRVGRGTASGSGTTAGRGMNGQRSRSGGKGAPYVGFEGGQMPIYRRVPKRGFTNIFKKDVSAVNVEKLNVFRAGEEVNAEKLIAKGLIRKNSKLIKVLGHGELKKKLTIKVNAISKSALEKVESAGGTFEAVS